MRSRLAIALGTSMVLLANVGGAQETSVGSKADAELRRRVEAGWSGAAIIEYRGRVVLREGYGLANREAKIPFTTRTVAQFGSLTKQFTAAAVVALAREKRLSVTDSIARHVPEVRGVARSITLHELLTHSSGLPQYCGGDFDRAPEHDLVERCLDTAKLDTRGTYAYSNPGYSVLGIVVERVTGEPLETFLRRRFFDRLGMKHIGYQFHALPADLGPAVCYQNDMRQRPIAENIAELGDAYWNLKGNGGMQAPAEEMYMWYRALRARTALPQDGFELLTFPHVKRPDPGASYAYGWSIRQDSTGAVVQISHSGSDGVCAAAFVWRPVDDAFIYVVGNSGDRATLDAASALLRIVRDQQ
jgi:CubicO group peptidase (beta-lactamase class C family)